MSVPKTQRICGKEATLFRDGPPPVYILPDGRFAIEWGEKWTVRASLKSIEKLIGRDKPSVTLFSVDDRISFTSRTVQVVKVCEMGDSRLVDVEGKKHYVGYSNAWYVLDDQARIAGLRNLCERIKAVEQQFCEEFKHLMRGAKQVRPYNFKDILKKAQQGDVPGIFDDMDAGDEDGE